MQKRLKPSLLVLPVFFLLCSFCLSTAASTGAQNNEQLLSEIEAVNVELNYLKIKLDDSKKKTKNLEKKVKEKQKQIKELAEQIADLTENQRLIASQAEVLSAESSVLKTEQSMLLERFRSRIVQFYKIKQETLINCVFAAKDINGFLNRYQMVKYLLNSDKQLIDSLKSQAERQKQLEENLKTQKQRLEDSKKEIANRNSRLQKEKKALNAMLSTVLLEKKVYLKREKTLAKSLNELERQIETIEKKQDTEALSKELKQPKEQLASKTQGGTAKKEGPSFAWPVSDKHKIRAEEIDSVNAFVGIELKPDAQIMASNRGKVVYRGSISGFGNVIIIAHEKGFSTVYARLDEMWVGLGQIVEQGEEIGRIIGGHGSNNVLHFEIRFGGKRKKPLDYLP